MSGLPPVRHKESFDAAAEDFARYRPGYPDQVVDDVVTMSRLQRGSRVLEIGCGTGQLSVPLAKRGVHLVAVELGPNLAAIARRNLSGFRGSGVEVSGFEEWPLLRPGGILTIVHAHHVKGGTPGFLGRHPTLLVAVGAQRRPVLRADRARGCSGDVSRAGGPFRVRRRSTPPIRDPEVPHDRLLCRADDTKYEGRVSRNVVYEVISATRA